MYYIYIYKRNICKYQPFSTSTSSLLAALSLPSLAGLLRLDAIGGHLEPAWRVQT